MMGTRISVVRLAAIILMDRRILMGILVIRMRKAIAIKLVMVMLTKLILRFVIVVVRGAMWAMMRRGVKAFGLWFDIGILVPMVGISMPAARKLWIIGTWRGKDRSRGAIPPIMPRRTGRTRRTRRASIGRRARRRWRRRRRCRRGRWRGRWRRRCRRRRRGRRKGRRRGRRSIRRSALAMDMRDVDCRLRRRRRDGKARMAILATLVAVIGLADA